MIRNLGPSPAKMLAQVHAVEAEQQRQKKDIDFKIYGMPHSGDLRDFFRVTDQGRTYLAIRAQSEATREE